MPRLAKWVKPRAATFAAATATTDPPARSPRAPGTGSACRPPARSVNPKPALVHRRPTTKMEQSRGLATGRTELAGSMAVESGSRPRSIAPTIGDQLRCDEFAWGGAALVIFHTLEKRNRPPLSSNVPPRRMGSMAKKQRVAGVGVFGLLLATVSACCLALPLGVLADE